MKPRKKIISDFNINYKNGTIELCFQTRKPNESWLEVKRVYQESIDYLLFWEYLILNYEGYGNMYESFTLEHNFTIDMGKFTSCGNWQDILNTVQAFYNHYQKNKRLVK